jgi:hypothetical protein
MNWNFRVSLLKGSKCLRDRNEDHFKLPNSILTPENAKVWLVVAVGARLALKILRD